MKLFLTILGCLLFASGSAWAVMSPYPYGANYVMPTTPPPGGPTQWHVCCGQNDVAQSGGNGGVCVVYNPDQCHGGVCNQGEPNCQEHPGPDGRFHWKNAGHTCGFLSWYGWCTPEMSDYLAILMVAVIGMRIYFFRRRSQASA